MVKMGSFKVGKPNIYILTIFFGVLLGILSAFSFKLFILAVVSIPLLVLLFYKLEWGLFLYLLILPFHTVLPSIPIVGINFRTLLVCLIFVIFIIKLSLGKIKLRFDKLSLYVVLFFLTNLLSLVFTKQITEYGIDVLWRYIYAMVLYFLLIQMVDSKKLFKQTLWVLVTSGLIFSFGGIFQLLVGEGLNVVGGVEFLIDNNRYVRLIIPLIPLCFFLSGSQKEPYKKLFLVIVFFILVFAGLIAVSKAGLLVIFLMLFLIFIKQKNKLRILFIMFVLFLFMLPFVPTTLWQRAGILVGVTEGIKGVDDNSLWDRANIVVGGVRMFAHNPILGVGTGNFPSRYADYKNVGARLGEKAAHNSFLSILAETGIVGFLIFGMILIASIKNVCDSKKIFEKNKEMLGLSQGVEIALVGFLVFAFFMTSEYVYSFWVLFALTGCLRNIAEAEK